MYKWYQTSMHIYMHTPIYMQYICIYVYIHTYTHTHIFIFILCLFILLSAPNENNKSIILIMVYGRWSIAVCWFIKTSVCWVYVALVGGEEDTRHSSQDCLVTAGKVHVHTWKSRAQPRPSVLEDRPLCSASQGRLGRDLTFEWDPNTRGWK